MDDPQIQREWKQAIDGEILTLADTHAGVPLEQQEITRKSSRCCSSSWMS